MRCPAQASLLLSPAPPLRDRSSPKGYVRWVQRSGTTELLVRQAIHGTLLIEAEGCSPLCYLRSPLLR